MPRFSKESVGKNILWIVRSEDSWKRISTSVLNSCAVIFAINCQIKKMYIWVNIMWRSIFFFKAVILWNFSWTGPYISQAAVITTHLFRNNRLRSLFAPSSTSLERGRVLKRRKTNCSWCNKHVTFSHSIENITQ